MLALSTAILSLAADPYFYPLTNIAEHFTSLGCPTCVDALAGITVVHDQLHNGEFVSARHYIQGGDLSYPGVEDRFGYYDIFSTPVMVFNGRVKVIGGGDNVIDGAAYLNALKASRYWGSPLKINLSGFNLTSGSLSGTVHNLSPTLNLTNANIVYLLVENDIAAGVTRVIRQFASAPFAISGQGTNVSFNHTFSLQPSWNVANLWAAVFIQIESQTILQTATTLPQPDIHIRAAFDWNPSITVPVVYLYESLPVYFFNLGQSQTFIMQIVVDSAPPNWYFNYCTGTGGCFPGSIPRPFTLSAGESIPLQLNILVGDSGVAQFHWLITAPGMQDYKVHFTMTTDDVSASDPALIVPPAAIRSIHPNPFTDLTRIRFDLPKAERVKMDIYNLRGQHIITLTDSHHGAGDHEIIWNGRDKAGTAMPPGIYFSRLLTPNATFTRKLIRLER